MEGGACASSLANCRFRSPWPVPSLCMAKPKMPLSASEAVASSTTAPAPSPNRMHEFRSSQSTHLWCLFPAAAAGVIG